MTPEEIKEKVLQRLKSLNSIKEDDVTYDHILETIIEFAYDSIIIYCHLEYDEFPPMLYTTLIFMCYDYLRRGGWLKSEDDIEDGKIKSIREGDVTVQMATDMEIQAFLQSDSSVMSSYYYKLNSFRRFQK